MLKYANLKRNLFSRAWFNLPDHRAPFAFGSFNVDGAFLNDPELSDHVCHLTEIDSSLCQQTSSPQRQ